MSKEQQKCSICYEARQGINHFFAKCQHKGTCLKCCEQHLRESIAVQKIPKCVNCDAVMIEQGNNFIYPYFSDNTKHAWKKAKSKIYKKNKSQPCQVPDCQGIIKAGKCLKCCQFYCERCFNIEHIGKCKEESDGSLISGDGKIKKCPKCNIPIEQNGGCMFVICPCQHKFCFICLEDWTNTHHLKHGPEGVKRGVLGWLSENFGCLGPSRSPKAKK